MSLKHEPVRHLESGTDSYTNGFRRRLKVPNELLYEPGLQSRILTVVREERKHKDLGSSTLFSYRWFLR